MEGTLTSGGVKIVAGTTYTLLHFNPDRTNTVTSFAQTYPGLDGGTNNKTKKAITMPGTYTCSATVRHFNSKGYFKLVVFDASGNIVNQNTETEVRTSYVTSTATFTVTPGQTIAVLMRATGNSYVELGGFKITFDLTP